MEMGEKEKKEMEILQFFVDRNGKCTHAEYENHFTPLGPLEGTHPNLFQCEYIQYLYTQYILTPKGRERLTELRKMANDFNKPPQDSEES